MSCISEILSSLRESRVKETTFVYNGSEYENQYGNYRKNRRPITREEYHKARKELLAQKDEEDSISSRVNEPHKKLAADIEELQDFINGLEYDSTYKVARETRGHLPRIDPYDEYERIAQIVDDIGVSAEEAKDINSLISAYTSTDNYTTFSDEEKALIDKYIDLSPVYSPPPVYRGLGFRERLGEDGYAGYKFFSELEEGTEIALENYASFSSNPDLAVEFSNTHGDRHVYMVNTRNLSGVSIDHLCSIDYHEDELIYKAGTKFQILEKVVGEDVVYLHVSEIPLEEGDDDNAVVAPISGSMYIGD